jgi:hypothetical protein
VKIKKIIRNPSQTKKFLNKNKKVPKKFPTKKPKTKKKRIKEKVD